MRNSKRPAKIQLQSELKKVASEIASLSGALLFILGMALVSLQDAHASPCLPGRPCPVSPAPARPAPRPAPVAPAPRPIPVTGPGSVVAAPCPSRTVLDPVTRRCVSAAVPGRPPVSRGPMRPVPAASVTNRDEYSAANIVNEAMRGLDCDQAAQALRRLSNQLLSMSATAGVAVPTGRPEPDFKREARERIRSQAFWTKVWNRMADAYRACDRTCFDDGLAVGEISATSYCSASIAVDGLPGIGFIPQTPLPVCETAIYAGCVQSYQKTAGEYSGCRPYTTDRYASIFNEYQSQDCHL